MSSKLEQMKKKLEKLLAEVDELSNGEKKKKNRYYHPYQKTSIKLGNVSIPPSKVTLLATYNLGGEATSRDIHKWLQANDISLDRRRFHDPIRKKLMETPQRGIHRTTPAGEQWCLEFAKKNNLEITELV